jgi:hypothetical protein
MPSGVDRLHGRIPRFWEHNPRLEALEVLLTGHIRRLKGRTAVWQTGWRSLHTQAAPEVKAELAIEGIEGAALTGTWAGGAKLDDLGVRVKVTGEPDSGMERFGGRALGLPPTGDGNGPWTRPKWTVWPGCWRMFA